MLILGTNKEVFCSISFNLEFYHGKNKISCPIVGYVISFQYNLHGLDEIDSAVGAAIGVGLIGIMIQRTQTFGNHADSGTDDRSRLYHHRLNCFLS